jgi:hypothetical protein
VRRNLVEEEPGVKALALQPALHVCHGDDDGVDLLHADRVAQRLDIHNR